jgi:hypothetical protein
MSFESTEERIGKLENQVESLLNIQKAALESNQKQFQFLEKSNIGLLKLALLLKNNQDALVRYITNSSLITDKGVRQHFLDQVSRWESASEQTEKMLADLEKAHSEPLPPDDPPAPGPA